MVGSQGIQGSQGDKGSAVSINKNSFFLVFLARVGLEILKF